MEIINIFNQNRKYIIDNGLLEYIIRPVIILLTRIGIIILVGKINKHQKEYEENKIREKVRIEYDEMEKIMKSQES